MSYFEQYESINFFQSDDIYSWSLVLLDSEGLVLYSNSSSLGLNLDLKPEVTVLDLVYAEKSVCKMENFLLLPLVNFLIKFLFLVRTGFK